MWIRNVVPSTRFQHGQMKGRLLLNMAGCFLAGGLTAIRELPYRLQAYAHFPEHPAIFAS